MDKVPPAFYGLTPGGYRYFAFGPSPAAGAVSQTRPGSGPGPLGLLAQVLGPCLDTPKNPKLYQISHQIESYGICMEY